MNESHRHYKNGSSHRHDGFAGLFEYRNVAQKRLVISLVITAVVMILEIVGGMITGSIALLSDAGHMFTHSFAIAISLVAVIIARKPACHHRTFGLYRAEILAAFINGMTLLFVVGIILYEAVNRIIKPEEINAVQMLRIALIGLTVNVASILILRSGYKTNLNIRSVFYHMVGDAASSVGIVIAAAVIFYTDWNILDPVISIGISILIFIWAVNILKESGTVLLEMAPRGLDVDLIEEDLKKKFPRIVRMEKVHLWSITTDMLVFSAHMVIRDENGHDCCRTLLPEINRYLCDKFNIIEATIQRIEDRPSWTVCEK
ncbi:MAG: cation transporter [Actinobacteria bacterium]|nr:cation transporter [Actinomycetota bacterium]